MSLTLDRALEPTELREGRFQLVLRKNFLTSGINAMGEESPLYWINAERSQNPPVKATAEAGPES